MLTFHGLTIELPANETELVVLLHRFSEATNYPALALVLDMLADMPDDVAVRYADRVRMLGAALGSVPAIEVADILDAYAAALDDESPAPVSAVVSIT